MDTLSGIMRSEVAEDEIEEEGEERRGRPRELKSYLVETNSKPSESYLTEKFQFKIRPTGLDNLKILQLGLGMSKSAEFYVDMQDERFWVMHTGALANDAHRLVSLLTHIPEFQFDRAWIPAQMLEGVTKTQANRFEGFGLDYYDYFVPEDSGEVPIEELSMSVSGSNAKQALDAMRSKPALQKSVSYNKIRIKRGDVLKFAKDDITQWGNFSVKDGDSIDDHIALVEEVRGDYRQAVSQVEKSRLVGKESGNPRLEGKAFNITFESASPGLEFFIERLFSGTEPFRLWGIKSRVDKDYYQVNAIDLHSGYPLDFEIAPGLIRVYLSDRTCGNALLRLYVNLQHYFDSRVSCPELYS